MFRMLRLVLATGVALVASGCVSVIAPIRPYGYEERAASTLTDFSESRRMAERRLAEWDQAVRELQYSNATAGTLLPAAAGVIGLRAARSKASAATANLATAGRGHDGVRCNDSAFQVECLHSGHRGDRVCDAGV